jgi:hypothetical protein
VERLADAGGCAFSGPATWCLRFPRVHDGLQKRTRRENHGASEEACVAADTHTDSALLAIDGLGENLFDQFLAQIDVWVFFDLAFDIELIRFLIGLSPGGVHRRPLAAIEQPELDPRAIDRLTHQSTERIDLANDLAFGNPTDRWVAAHLPDRIEVPGQKCDACANTCRSGSRFCAGMPGPNHHYVVFVSVDHS